MATRTGGTDRISTKARLARELAILGKVLSGARKASGVRQSDLAQRLGVPASYLSKIESGSRRLDVVEFVSIVRAMGADPATLVRELEEALAAPPAGASEETSSPS